MAYRVSARGSRRGSSGGWRIEYLLEVAGVVDVSGAVDGAVAVVVDDVGSDVGVLVVAGRRHARLDLDRSPECTLGLDLAVMP